MRNLVPMFPARYFLVTMLSAMPFALPPCLFPAESPLASTLRTNDIVAFVGGSDVAAAQHAGHLEVLLAVRFPGARFRNFGWEGDTVFAQRRDFGFPSRGEHLKRARVSVLFIEFGRAEAVSGKETVGGVLCRV